MEDLFTDASISSSMTILHAYRVKQMYSKPNSRGLLGIPLSEGSGFVNIMNINAGLEAIHVPVVGGIHLVHIYHRTEGLAQ